MNAQADWITQETQAKRRRDRGVRRAAEHAEDTHEGWGDKANERLKAYVAALGDKKFLTENFAQWATKHGLPAPPDGRAFGGVMQRACREGVVAKAGYGSATSSNMSPKILWVRAPR